MCFPFDAEPPITPISGAAVDSEDLVLKSADGTEFAAFVARAGNDNAVGVVVLPDVRGLFHFYEELALRFAEQGINAVAIDYFGRTAGVSKRGEDFEFMDHVMKTQHETVSADTGAALDYLRSAPGGSCTKLFTVGFCFGGSNSWLQAAEPHGLAGAIGFYGRPGPGFTGAPSPSDAAPRMTCPILGLMGGADQSIPIEDVNAYRNALTAAGVENEVIVYDGAPHSFFDRAFEEFAKESEDAWQRCLAFIQQNAA